MQETPSPFINAIYDREPLQQFVHGRIVLVGEAAHPTTPHALRSTNMAITDAGAGLPLHVLAVIVSSTIGCRECPSGITAAWYSLALSYL